jgi:hypothetical protein
MLNKTISLISHVDAGHEDGKRFCKLTLSVGEDSLGNPGAWSMVRLMRGGVKDMLDALSRQAALVVDDKQFLSDLPSKALFDALYSWQWSSGEWAYESECPLTDFNSENFFALPLATEIFDREVAYIVSGSSGKSRFLWREYGSRLVREIELDLNDYLNEWNELCNKMANDSWLTCMPLGRIKSPDELLARYGLNLFSHSHYNWIDVLCERLNAVNKNRKWRLH